MERDHNLVWTFVEQHYPNYTSCPKIAHNNDLLTILEQEDEEGSSARKLLESYEWADYNNPLFEADFTKSCCEIYEIAITAFVNGG